MNGTNSRIVTWEELPVQYLAKLKAEKRKAANAGTRKGRRYLDIVTAFDIETSPIPGREEAGMYVWQWQFGLDYTVMGRTWEELRQLIDRLLKTLPEDLTLVILVHNLSYEFQFLRTIYKFKASEVFAVDRRKVLKCTMYDRRLEYRCTYLHSNMSLKAYLKKMDVEHQKISGEEFDYSKIRYPWTPLSDLEIQYCQNDVLGLVEAYMAQMQRDGDNLQSMPLTSTGYVRRDAKRAMRLASRQMVPDMQPDLDQYRLLRECFRGGNTHANRYYVGHVVHDVHSADRSSSYPDVICNRMFPITKFRWLGVPDIRYIRRHIKQGHAVAMRVALWDVNMRDPYDGFPYLARSKCYKVIDGVYDNGRILKAAYLETSCTDVDFRIISRQYKWKHIKGIRAMWAHYGPLPRPLVLTAIEYYTQKTALKGITSDDGIAEYLYARSKELLNALYGMMAQDPVKFNLLFNEDYPEVFRVEDDQDPGEILLKYQRRAFLAYQWGVWVTAWAREALQVGLDLAGHNAVYCDTDSVKYIGDVNWKPFNDRCVDDCLKNGAHATDAKGEEHFMGVYEMESTSDMVTLGAKKYANQYPDGHLVITVAGVNKKKGGDELLQAGGLPAFRNGFIFRDGGGLESIYNDQPGSRWLEIDGHSWEIGPNIYLKPSTYTLGQTADYIRLLSDPMIWKKVKHRFL